MFDYMQQYWDAGVNASCLMVVPFVFKCLQHFPLFKLESKAINMLYSLLSSIASAPQRTAMRGSSILHSYLMFNASANGSTEQRENNMFIHIIVYILASSNARPFYLIVV